MFVIYATDQNGKYGHFVFEHETDYLLELFYQQNSKNVFSIWIVPTV